jgi:hypothetical protein
MFPRKISGPSTKCIYLITLPQRYTMSLQFNRENSSTVGGYAIKVHHCL